MKNFPFKHFPSGWFQVAWSGDLQPGDVKPVHFFDMDFVLFRTESGKAALLEAYCAHMGAHLGHGGKVVGESVACPFHGWQYAAESGKLVEIPYSERCPSQTVRKWEIRESMGMVLMWHDAEGAPPQWDPPAWPEAESDDYYRGPESRTEFVTRTQPQMVIENIVDAAHQKFIHGATNITSFDEAKPDGHVFRVLQHVILGEGKKKTWLTDKPTPATMHIEGWGLGIGLVNFVDTDGAVIIHTSTPIDHEKCAMFTAMLVRKTPKSFVNGELTKFGKKRIAVHFKQVAADIPVWDNMSYVLFPPFAGVEVPTFAVFRKWTEQFYPESDRKLIDDLRPGKVKRAANA